jgi:hypothetical protein
MNLSEHVEKAAHGTLKPVTVTIDDKILKKFLEALSIIKDHSTINYQSNYSILQDKDTTFLESIFHDANYKYTLSLEMNWRK